MDRIITYPSQLLHDELTRLTLLTSVRLFGDTPGDSPDKVASFIGIVIAISGNIVISLALNCQKLAHLRIEERREQEKKASRPSRPSRRRRSSASIAIREESEPLLDDTDEEEIGHGHDRENNYGSTAQENGPTSDNALGLYQTPTRSRRGAGNDPAQAFLLESEPLLVVASPPTSILNGHYGPGPGGRDRRPQRSTWDSPTPTRRRGGGVEFLSRLFSPKKKARPLADRDADLEVAVAPIPTVDVQINEPLRNGRSKPSALKFADSPLKDDGGKESDYLKSKLWWTGFLLMNVGEMGNFISYGFAPASIVAPLGTFALIANCFFAPLMLKEKFRKRDMFGIALAILGAVTVVLSANPSDTRFDRDGLLHALAQRAFIVLATIYAVGAVVLVGLSSREIGQDHVFVDVGVCALFGGFTVLSTKAFSSLLTLEWVNVFKEWITYPVLAVLIGTGVGQIRYLNRALMKFDSKVVIPTQFVLFNLSAIVGSAVLYGDFRRATLHQMMTFLYGCGATFAGVFLLTWGAPAATVLDDEEPQEERVQDRAERTSRGQLTLPSAAGGGRRRGRSTPILRNRASSVSLVGLSPAQRVLLVRASGESLARDDDLIASL